MRFEAGRVPTANEIGAVRLQALVTAMTPEEGDESTTDPDGLRLRFPEIHAALEALGPEVLVDHIVSTEL